MEKLINNWVQSIFRKIEKRKLKKRLKQIQKPIKFI
jgi:hypothetical protein